MPGMKENVSRPFRSYQYGADASQQADLYLPTTSQAAVVCLLHGGFWRMPHGREQYAAVAEDIAARGFAVWNIGYRRIDEAGGGWPTTLQDAVLAIDYLSDIVDDGEDLDLGRVVVVGHSAGGQLALWAAAHNKRQPFELPSRVQPIAAAGLAAAADLAKIYALDSGHGAVYELLGGSPTEYPDRYAAASPSMLLPLQVEQLIAHGDMDDVLPIELSRNYADLARARGDRVEFHALQRFGHMDFLNPIGPAHEILCEWLARICAGRAGL
jgi:acetyl esterase/lipase